LNNYPTQLKPTCSRADVGSDRVRRALFVAYAFPPTGGVSVQRVTKFIKYLPEFGWDCSVLTVENPSVPIFDQSLLNEIPADTLVRRAKTFEPGYAMKSILAASEAAPALNLAGRAQKKLRDLARRTLNFVLQPDAQILWRPHALREGMKLLHEVPHDVIVATGPPFSSFLLAMTLSRKTGVPVAFDFRDEWTVMTYWENKQIGVVERFVQQRMQGHVLRHAALVLGTTLSTTHELKRLAIAAKSNARVENIYNGFDHSDYPAHGEAIGRVDYGNGVELFRLAFVGTLWNVTPIGPVVDAIVELSRRAPGLVAQLELSSWFDCNLFRTRMPSS
jgi:glycosyltransferase involved in cell wall biosynthesis